MLHGLKTRHEQQEESDYLKNKPLLKVPIISGMHVKNCLKKNPLIYRAVVRKCSYKEQCGRSLFFNRSATLLKMGLRHSCFPILRILRTTASEYHNNVPRAF